MLEIIEKITKGIVGRKQELITILAALDAGKHILLEGPPGTSKSTILRSIAQAANIPFYIIEGNIDLTPAKIVGHFSPSKVMADNYNPEYFDKGPLTKAMEEGGILYIEEFNRMPADVSNALITPMEEGEMHIPRYGLVQALKSFTVVAAQNPFDDVGTVRVSRAFMDRICLVKMDYQSEEEEHQIVWRRTGFENRQIIAASVKIVRKTREHSDIKLGASVRAAIDLVDIFRSLQKINDQPHCNFIKAAHMALHNKIWLNEITNRNPDEIIEDIWEGMRVEFKELATSNGEKAIKTNSTSIDQMSEDQVNDIQDRQENEKKKMSAM